MELKQTLIDSAAWRKRIDGTQGFLFALTSDEGKLTSFLLFFPAEEPHKYFKDYVRGWIFWDINKTLQKK